jgi:glutamyl-tRNA reductase
LTPRGYDAERLGLVLVNFGVNYKSAPLATLDSVTLRGPARFYQILKGVAGIRGAVILQTCNRVEFFLEVEVGAEVVDQVLRHWALETRFKLEELTRLVDRKLADNVIEHLVRLASGLESMLVGESQILGQVRNALAEACAIGATTPLLVKLFDRATSSASKIREISGIGKGAFSVGSAAVSLAEKTLGPLRDKHVLLIGTGQVGMLLMKALKTRHVGNVTVVSRTIDRAQAFSREYGGYPADFLQLNKLLDSSDIVFVATSATGHLLTKEILVGARDKNVDTKLIVFDLSKPRSVSPDVQDVHGVDLRTIDDLRSIADGSLVERREVVRQTEALVRERSENIVATFRRERPDPIVSDVHRLADKVRPEEVAKSLVENQANAPNMTES